MMTMKKIKTSEAAGPLLDWLVAKCEGHTNDPYSWLFKATLSDVSDSQYKPSKYWGQGGPIVERERMLLQPIHAGPGKQWVASVRLKSNPIIIDALGSTSLIAAMRCYVASKLGEEVEVPEELL